ncbi:MAG TPA: hypothetical protein VI565_03325 [Burkholderiales bacterium]|nr:hypothetical protein [Burkholderiales bacterium]
MIALANQRGGKPLGFVNPALYALGKKKPASFRDIVVAAGTKAEVRRQYVNASDPKGGIITALKTYQEFGSNAPRAGYDTCTGLGSPGRTFLSAL